MAETYCTTTDWKVISTSVVANTHLTADTWSLLQIQISSLAIANPVSTALELLCSTSSDFVNQTNVINITISYGTATKAEM